MSSKPNNNNNNNITQSLLSRAHSPTSTQRILTEKIQNRPLLLKPTEPSSSSGSSSNARDQRRLHRARLAARRKRLRPAPLSAREKRALRVHDIPVAERRYAIYEPLNRLWAGYVREVLAGGEQEESSKKKKKKNGGGPAAAAGAGAAAAAGGGVVAVDSGAVARLVSADFHGAELLVVRSRCVSRVGLRGIVVRDSRFAFVLVTRADEVRVVPKEHTVFRFEVPPLSSPPPSPPPPSPGGADAGRGGVGGGILCLSCLGTSFAIGRRIGRIRSSRRTSCLTSDRGVGIRGEKIFSWKLRPESSLTAAWPWSNIQAQRRSHRRRYDVLSSCFASYRNYQPPMGVKLVWGRLVLPGAGLIYTAVMASFLTAV